MRRYISRASQRELFELFKRYREAAPLFESSDEAQREMMLVVNDAFKQLRRDGAKFPSLRMMSESMRALTDLIYRPLTKNYGRGCNPATQENEDNKMNLHDSKTAQQFTSAGGA